MEEYIDRQQLKSEIIQTLLIGKSVAIYAPQFFGKSVFLEQIRDDLSSSKIVIFLKFEFIFSLDDFFLKLKNEMRTVLNVDFESKRADSLERLEGIFKALLYEAKSRNKQIFVLIDDFDEIEKIQSTNKQELNSVLNSVFGNQRSVIFCLNVNSPFWVDMFENKKSILFDFANVFTLPRLQDQEIAKFIKDEFKESDLEISEASIKLIIENTNNMPYYVGSVCREIILNKHEKIDDKAIMSAVDEVYHQNKYIFMLQMRAIKGRKYISQILLKIAKGENPYTLIYTEENLVKSNLFFLLSSLEKENMILKIKKAKEKPIFLIYDPFFKRYILENL
ncbi:hypothetical protein [Campylobacter sp. CCUG 57310]|uniref:hypothetical protein n=1 Tax=Campylobacter sp. CCUG 57310 TaxID=2517362 RepID=UPI0015661565|nr:hypothetical protein [Campylobacter sp. CCUG 57310]QKF93233.1 hypothetical protein CORI_a047 [Campylobacter sp. CCUG 57310]